MTTNQPPSVMRTPVDARDLSPVVVMKGLEAVERPRREPDLDTAALLSLGLDDGDNAAIDRSWSGSISLRMGWFDAADYDRDNADGLGLAQAVIDELREQMASDHEVKRLPHLVDRWARAAAYKLSPALAWRNTAQHNPEPPEAFLDEMARACARTGIKDPTLRVLAGNGEHSRTVRDEYRQAVQAWAFVRAELDRSGGSPVKALQHFMRVRAEVATSQGGRPADDRALRALMQATKRARRSLPGRKPSWDAMQAVWQDTLIERAAAHAVRLDESWERSAPPPPSWAGYSGPPPVERSFHMR